MQLIIDIGNSNVVIGIYQDDHWRHIWRMPTREQENALFFYEMHLTNYMLEVDLSAKDFHQVVLSSVVPDLYETFEALSLKLLGQPAVVVGPEIYPKVDLQIDRPDEIGTDLLANAIAAKDIYKSDAIVVDFGTALTFTAITVKGYILGVSIAPGLKTAINALYQNTAQLPEVPLELPSSVVGKNTAHAIQSGVLNGYVGLVRHMIREFRRELGSSFLTIATGGMSSILHPLSEDFDIIDPELTLNGLRVIGDYVKAKDRSPDSE